VVLRATDVNRRTGHGAAGTVTVAACAAEVPVRGDVATDR
jgi:hypothetical protein